MMKKFLLMMLFCVTQVVAWGQANVSTSHDGTTYTITGFGDITTQPQVPGYTFDWRINNKGNEVYTSENEGSKVAGGSVYNSSLTYYVHNGANYVEATNVEPLTNKYVLINATYKKEGNNYVNIAVGTEVVAGDYFNLTPANADMSDKTTSGRIFTLNNVPDGKYLWGYSHTKWADYKIQEGTPYVEGDDYYLCPTDAYWGNNNEGNKINSSVDTYLTDGTIVNDGANVYVQNGLNYELADGKVYDEDATYYTIETSDFDETSAENSTINKYIADNTQKYYTRSGEEGSYTYSAVNANTLYDAGTTYYEISGFLYKVISLGEMQSLYYLNSTTLDFWSTIYSEIKDLGCTKVVFAQAAEGETCVVSSTVINAVLTQNYTFNTNVKILDISGVSVDNTNANDINGNLTLNVVDKDGMTIEELAARYTKDRDSYPASISSKQTVGGGEPNETDVLVKNANAVDFSSISDVVNLVLGGGASITTTLLAQAESTGATNLITAKMTGGITTGAFAEFTNNTIKRVILPDNTYIPSLSKLSTGCPIYQVYDSSTRKETIIIADAGGLGAIKDYHYYSTDIDNAYWIEVEGNINAADIAFLNGINNDRLNLSRATSGGDEAALREAMHGFANPNVKYLAWPIFTTEPSNPLYTDLYAQCANLVAVGQYVQMGNDQFESQGQSYDVKYGKLVANTKEPGKIKEITDMLAEVTREAAGHNPHTAIRYLKVSGNLNAADLYKFDDANGKIGADGHLYFTESVDEYASTGQVGRKNANDPNGESTTAGALNGCGGLVSIDLSDAVFERYEDMSLMNLNLLGTTTKEVKIPTSPLVTDLPADFLNAATSIEEICIPANIQNIHARAFYGLHLKHVWTTGTDPEVKYDNGATYEVGEGESMTLESYVYGDEIPENARMVYGTYTFSPNVKFIGSGVFGGSDNIHDVYMLGKQAPVCCVDAFSTESYVANNSYQASAVVDKIDRDKYANAKYVWMTVLHFPAECTTDQAKLYTDVTRQYSIASDERDGRGKIIYYPTMCEWNRSFIQGTTGYLWNAFGAERNGLSGTAMGFYNNEAAKAAKTAMNDSYKTSRTQDNYQAATNGYYNESDNAQKSTSIFYNTDVTTTPESEKLSYNETLYNADYRGWHQFVLAAYGYSDDYKIDFHDFSDNNWWTICEPYSLTAGELKKAFGADVDLRKLISVTRDIAGQHITLNFDQNHLTGAADNAVILEAGVPYMIKPSISDADRNSNPDVLALAFEKTAENDARFAPKSAATLISLLETGKYTVPAYVINNTGDYQEPTKEVEGNVVHKHLEYTMVGTFFQYHFPLYCYFLGWNSSLNGGAGGVQFFWNNKLDKVNRSWNPFTAIIVPHIKENITFYRPNGEFETIHYIYDAKERFGDTDDYCATNSALEYTPSMDAEAKRTLVSTVLEFNYEDGNNATGIDNVVKTNPYLNNKVYNMNGQLINNGNNNQRIAKGVYISNGKKFIVK